MSRLTAVLCALSVLLFLSAARADTVEAPLGGKPVPLPAGRIACAVSAGGWAVEPDKKSIKPPATETASTSLVVATSDAACATSKESVALIPTSAWPTVDAVIAFFDDARIELKGKKLRGARVHWESGAQSGDETCVDVRTENDSERCGIPIVRGLTEPPRVTVLPAGAVARDDAAIYDETGKRVSFDRVRATASRVVVSTLIRPDVTLDALGTSPSFPLQHAEAVASVDCYPASCVLDGARVVVGSLPNGTSSLTVRFKLAKGVALRVGEALETTATVKVPVLRCPLSVESGTPMRAIDGQRVVIRLEGRCAAEAKSLHFSVAGVAAERVDTVVTETVAHVALRLPRTESDELTISATRGEGDFVIAQTHVATREAPSVRVGLELGGHAIDFVPTNADAIAHATATNWDGALSVLPVDGMYASSVKNGVTRVRGVAGAFGQVSLRVGLRRASLPAPLDALDLVVLIEPVQRPIRESSTPLPVLDAKNGDLVELVCDTGNGPTSLAVGSTSHVPFDRHESCKLVFHSERIDASAGAQKLVLDVDVTRVDGTPRSEARISRTITLTPGKAPRTLFLHGADGRFDRYSVRLTRAEHAEGDIDAGLPDAQWSVVTGRGSARLYATTAIPTGLYRVSDRDHSGLLTLNFGVLARFTWLDSLGHEGLLALETGVVGVGLANDTSPSGRSLTQASIVTGVGLSVPIANRALATETAVNLHAWLEYEPGRAAFGSGSPWAFVFGPSVSIGNLGADF